VQQIAGGYRANFFLGFMLANSAALTGFACSFVVGGHWPLATALPFFVIGMAMIAPTRGNLGRTQSELNRAGINVDLIAALNQVPTQT
jgi:hypothetical protein